MTNTNNQTIEKKESVKSLAFLDALRGIAAFIVMVGHARMLLWEGYTEGFLKHPSDYSIIDKVLVYALSIFRWGHQSVLFFFVLSGFVIHLKYSKSLKNDPNTKFDLSNYILRRARRIYPPFLFAIVITYLLDLIGHQIGYSIYFSKTPSILINSNVGSNHNLLNLIGNLFFLQTDTIVIWGSNGPSWSLKYECWFYLIYPILFWFNKKSIWLSCLVVIILFVASFGFNYLPLIFFISIFKYLLSWWLGALLADIYTKRIKAKHLILSSFTLMLPFSMIVSEKINNNFIIDTFWAIGFFGLLNLFFFLQERKFTFKWTDKLKWLGESSYTLYIIHFPILVFINGIILSHTNNLLPKSLMYVILSIVILPSIAYLLHFITEKPFTKKHYA